MSETKLKPCPFCGAKATLYMENEEAGEWAGCTNGQCGMPIDYMRPEEWNTRAPSPLEPLARFGRVVLSAHRSNGESYDVDGFALEEIGKECGVLECVKVTESCGENCACVEFHGEFPCECLRETEAAKAIDIGGDDATA